VTPPAGDIKFVDRPPHSFSSKDRHRLSHISQPDGNLFSGPSAKNSQDDDAKGYFAFNRDAHHISGSVSKGVKQRQNRLIVYLMDHGADHRDPDQQLEDGEKKRDNTSALHGNDRSDGADGNITDARNKDQKADGKRIDIHHCIPLYIDGELLAERCTWVICTDL
jgi:hypothetical protein